ncbi:hypothetical protein CMV_015910 [Castanea mollissima]|uniref:Uncharacterized protein n=1 Tax=Castanea mollissima TaxID=60419 RepID=A0A8J4VSN9_9ROSI|nr:hypothetical protein CMV_015910 [Castanea mollissima]
MFPFSTRKFVIRIGDSQCAFGSSDLCLFCNQRSAIFDLDVKQNGLILMRGRVMLGVPVEVCNMLIDSSLVFHRSYNEKWIFYDIKCSLLCCGTIKSLEASIRHCADSVDTSVWRLIEFH